MAGEFQAYGHNELELASCLLSQQVWCWGRDIVRPEGNWLLETGFDRIEPPAIHSGCPSIYRLGLSRGRYVLLRGFGVFYGDIDLGGVFLPRYDFQPLYAEQAELDRPPWTREDLPRLTEPGPSQLQACATLVSDCVDWIWRYETQIVEQLGIEYRRATLHEWGGGGKSLIPAEDVASAWRAVSLRVAADLKGFLKPQRVGSRRSASSRKPAAWHWLRVKKQRSAPSGGGSSRARPRAGIPG